MSANIPDGLLYRLSQFISGEMGLHFSDRRMDYLSRGIERAAREFNFEDTGSCIRWLMSSPLTREKIKILASHLSIGETFFFREKQVFEILESSIFRELIESRRRAARRLSIWSAACSTGEEPYSLAVLLKKMIGDTRDWDISILATDINPLFLKKAAEGVYGRWSFRDTPSWVVDGYFIKRGDRYEIIPEIKRMVSFSYHNLVKDTYPSFSGGRKADVVFCRNLLIYFDSENKQKVIQRFSRCLGDEGWLVVGAAETPLVLFPRLRPVSIKGLQFFRKEGEKNRPAPVHAVPESAVGSAGGGAPAEMQEIYINQDSGSKHGLAEGKSGPACGDIILLARSLADQGRLDEALYWCEKAVEADRVNPVCHYLLAVVLQEKGRAEDAVMSLKRAVYLDQDFVMAHFTLGHIARRQGRSADSVRHLKIALELLRCFGSEDILPESGEMTAGRLKEIIQSYDCEKIDCVR